MLRLFVPEGYIIKGYILQEVKDCGVGAVLTQQRVREGIRLGYIRQSVFDNGPLPVVKGEDNEDSC